MLEFTMSEIKEWNIPVLEPTIRWCIAHGKLQRTRAAHLPGRPFVITEENIVQSHYEPLLRMLPEMRRLKLETESASTPLETGEAEKVVGTKMAGTPPPGDRNNLPTPQTSISTPPEGIQIVESPEEEKAIEEVWEFPTSAQYQFQTELRYIHQMQELLFDMLLEVIPAPQIARFEHLQNRAIQTWERAQRRSLTRV